MTDDYEAFCLVDPTFYDTPARRAASEGYPQAGRPVPPGWQRRADDQWVMLAPEAAELASQGWKVHLSGCLDNAERIVEAAWSYCVTHDLAFKFLCGPRVVLARNAKYAGRGGSGKLVTIYPPDEAALEVVCKDLAVELDGEPGPYILSDLRWGAGPVFVRYGGFRPRHCVDDQGRTVAAIEDATGTLVPDVRGPVFAVPEWVEIPGFLQPHLEARNTLTVAELPYAIEEALHFSNGGGVYRAADLRHDGRTVVLKEARPHAGLSGDGADAVTRLRREADVLRRLDGLAAVPTLFDAFAVGDHQFLAMEHIAGTALNQEVVRRCPLLDAAPAPEARADYARWAQAMHAAVTAAVEEIHRRGVVYGDMHMTNVIVRPDDTVALVDFEVAHDVVDGRRPGLGAMGFAAPAGRVGFDVDHHALAVLKLALFLPLEPLLGLDRTKAAELADAIADLFPVPRAWLDDAVTRITGGEPVAAPTVLGTGSHAPPRDPVPGTGSGGAADPGWPAWREALVQAIRASSTPERDDRLFPGDPAQFDPGGKLNLAHGAAGVLYALDVCGAERLAEHDAWEEWLVRHAHDPEAGTKVGLYDGLHGVAHVLARLGHGDEARRVLEISRREPPNRLGDDLYGGLAGVGLNLLFLADALDEPTLRDDAEVAVGRVADRLGTVDDVAEVSGGPHPDAGLLHGGAGKALLFLAWHDRTGDPVWLDHAAMALRQDLRRCVRQADGELHVNEGWRTMPYLARGSVGIGLVLRRYLAQRADDELADALAAIRNVACADFYAHSGLFGGRAGMILYLADLARSGAGPSDGRLRDDLDTQVGRLGWHALAYGGGVAFPGDQLLRLSNDLATGTAGVLLALGAAHHDGPVHLPFLPFFKFDETEERR